MAIHGLNSLIYVSGTELSNANAWSLSWETQTADVPTFGSSWISRVRGFKDWSGSVTEWLVTGASVLQSAAQATNNVSILIYPDRNVLTSYYVGDASFSFDSNASTGSAASRSANFQGAGTLTITGFS